MKFSFVIPCYNEAENLPLLVKRIEDVFNVSDGEVILVNNGSTDNSEKVLMELSLDSQVIRVVNVPENKGYGFGILAGLGAAKNEILGWTHADLQTDPKDLFIAMEIISKSDDPCNTFVKGYRVGRPIADDVFSVGMSVFESILMRKKMSEINAQPTVFHSSFFSKWDDAPFDFSLDLYAFYLAQKNKMNVERFNVTFGERTHGISNWNIDFPSKLKFIKRTILYSLKLRWSL